jgi:fumarate hydratase subunit beta
MRKIQLPFQMEELLALRAGEELLLSGEIITARDAAHLRLVDLLKAGKELPVSLENTTIYYVGPTPPKPGAVIGAAGPTSSYRMDELAIQLMPLGVQAMIGKGQRSKAYGQSLRQHRAVYLATYGGAGALLSSCITESQVIAFEDLGAEAIRRMKIQDFPVIVAMDTRGGDLYRGDSYEERND